MSGFIEAAVRLAAAAGQVRQVVTAATPGVLSRCDHRPRVRAKGSPARHGQRHRVRTA